MKFIKLTFSIARAGKIKPFYIQAEHISTMTEYCSDNYRSTKLGLISGKDVEVNETAEEIIAQFEQSAAGLLRG